MKKQILFTFIGALALMSAPLAMAQTITIPNLGSANVPILSNTTIPGVSGSALQARADALAAYNTIASSPCNITLSGGLSSQTVNATSGVTVVCVPGSTTLTGDLTLAGNPNSVFFIKVPGSLSTGANARVILPSGGTPNNVFFQVTGDANLGPNSNLQGTILANGNITVDPSATLNGRALSLNGAVTADPADIICPTCLAPSTGASILIQKTVINDNGGTAASTDFQFFVGGLRVLPGVRYVFAPGTYPVSELIVNGNYLASPWGGDCSPTGSVTLIAGANATCTVTNNDLPAGSIPPPPPPLPPPGIPDTGTGASSLPLFGLLLAAIGTGAFITSRLLRVAK